MANLYPSKLDKFIPIMPLDVWYLTNSSENIETVKEWIEGDYLRTHYLVLSIDYMKFKKMKH
jgi:hypothetical protein